MTTPILPSISDEELADIERHLSEQPSRSICCDVENHEVEAIIARLRAAEADAKRYRWLTGSNPTMGILERMTRGELIGHEIDTVIDRVMERTP